MATKLLNTISVKRTYVWLFSVRAPNVSDSEKHSISEDNSIRTGHDDQAGTLQDKARSF